MEVSGAGVDAVVREFSDHRFGWRHRRLAPGGRRRGLFRRSRARRGRRTNSLIDQAVARHLAEGWRLERMDATLRAILRAGAFELIGRPDVPVEVVIDEYVELAKSFFEGPEPGFVNGALDAIARGPAWRRPMPPDQVHTAVDEFDLIARLLRPLTTARRKPLGCWTTPRCCRRRRTKTSSSPPT
jgi:N utilization substance protein B